MSAAGVAAPSVERARYWFEQYRYASEWEARLILAIRELSPQRTPVRYNPHAEGSV